jgi:glycogen debranching enzyme
MKDNFERCFYVPLNASDDVNHAIDKKIVNKRGIYKDTFGSSTPYTDYQLRPNLCVAMAYAPDLFNEEHARVCLRSVEKYLMEAGCMGIKTLDP